LYFRNIFKMELKSHKGKQNRGFVAAGDEVGYSSLNQEELLELLKSPKPLERTISARYLGKSNQYQFVEHLIIALDAEQKLYPKIEICNSLAKFGAYSISLLVLRLGAIGKNQHLTVPSEPFRKNSYPLPRDIAARTLIRIGEIALPQLFEVLNGDERSKISEAIDAIGFICFKNPHPEYLGELKTCYRKHFKSELIRWKLIRAMSSFPSSYPFLQDRFADETQPVIRQEIKRSLDKHKKTLNIYKSTNYGYNDQGSNRKRFRGNCRNV
jgi:hypothetical protein